jgi:hypothetical protein
LESPPNCVKNWIIFQANNPRTEEIDHERS